MLGQFKFARLRAAKVSRAVRHDKQARAAPRQTQPAHLPCTTAGWSGRPSASIDAQQHPTAACVGDEVVGVHPRGEGATVAGKVPGTAEELSLIHI
eukprot:9491171-Alexandrium_andersonii.AAC.1